MPLCLFLCLRLIFWDAWLVFDICYWAFPSISSYSLFFFSMGLLLSFVVTVLFYFSLLFVLGCLKDITYIKFAK